MRKSILIISFLVACIATNAQVYIGGSLGFKSSKAYEDAESLTTWSVIPEIGYKIDDLISVGLQVGYSSQEYEYEYDYKMESFIISPYTRFTFTKSGLVRFFVDCGVTYKSYKADDYDDFEGYNIGVGIRPGIILEASKHINLVAKLGYLGYSKNSEDLGGGSEFGFDIDNTNISFGVFYNF